jgi:hypothetical protein
MAVVFVFPQRCIYTTPRVYLLQYPEVVSAPSSPSRHFVCCFCQTHFHNNRTPLTIKNDIRRRNSHQRFVPRRRGRSTLQCPSRRLDLQAPPRTIGHGLANTTGDQGNEKIVSILVSKLQSAVVARERLPTPISLTHSHTHTHGPTLALLQRLVSPDCGSQMNPQQRLLRSPPKA